MLQIKNLTVTHKKDMRTLVEDFSFVLNKGDRADVYKRQVCPLLVHINLFILLAVCKNIAVGVQQDHGIVETVPAFIQDLLVIPLFRG